MPSAPRPLHLRWLAGALALSATACAGKREVVIVDHQPAAQAPRNFGVFALGMSVDEAQREVEERSWTRQGKAEPEGQFIVVPTAGDPVLQYGVVAEAGKIVQLSLDYKDADDSRTELRHSYAVSKIQPDGAWAMTDTHRQTLVVVRDHGKRLVAIDLQASRDQAGVRAVMHKLLGE